MTVFPFLSLSHVNRILRGSQSLDVEFDENVEGAMIV